MDSHEERQNRRRGSDHADRADQSGQPSPSGPADQSDQPDQSDQTSHTTRTDHNQNDSTHKNARQNVIAVDKTDTALESVNRLEAHTGEGVRHRAFTALVFDKDDNVLLAQRAPEKRLWGSYWDGTVASHPVEGQSQEEATRQRLEEELGITPDQYDDLRVTDRFEYKRYFENAGVEHEVCAVLKLSLADVDLDPNEDEVAGLLWVPYERVAEHPEWYRQLRLCPWFEIAMRRDTQRGPQHEPGLE